ncbi:hypothetical protein [Candidatus Lucifugimonas marina]|uniref:Uncharacterized protein n=1 Tax=Candidatus Lucifugimonas marina TaxID=3038979 RepID=A0AAJ6CSZ3_9CHLR|nr:hypothetical protein [SAR202 cluster bacterium JH702]MDG0870908.1 hypothetical protein [SAR202 cluster bacterium JH639]WFG35858.1 hypothetical protein GKN94_09170 [SAR202 cluster bacterium JH545]WFG39803.1 hypothetical protein GKO48_09280 [SAR202 cluster bacterium JH1073]
MSYYETGQIEYRGRLLGDVEFRIRGLNTNRKFGRFNFGAGVVRGKMISALFDKRKAETVLVRNTGDRIPLTLFGLKKDGLTATVLVN